jgi:hypothetical protein
MVPAASSPLPDALLKAKESLNRLRALTPGQYLIRSVVESAAISMVSTPAFALFYFLDGVLAARYPRGYQPSPSGVPIPIPRTFPALISSASLYCVTCTFRTGGWGVFASGGAAALREGIQVGPRYQEPLEALEDPRTLLCGVSAGGLAAGGVTWDWVRAMGKARWVGYCGLGGAMGALLPVIFAKLGPTAKARVTAWLPKQPPQVVE